MAFFCAKKQDLGARQPFQDMDKFKQSLSINRRNALECAVQLLTVSELKFFQVSCFAKQITQRWHYYLHCHVEDGAGLQGGESFPGLP